MMQENTNNSSLLTVYTAEIVAAYLSYHQVSEGEVSPFIGRIYHSLQQLGSLQSSSLPLRSEPAVPIEKSITPEYIICLEDGQQMKMLKRHLRTTYNMTPEQYRKRWNLPANYPMVAPNYTKRRSTIAKKVGLGRGRKKNAA